MEFFVYLVFGLFERFTAPPVVLLETLTAALDPYSDAVAWLIIAIASVVLIKMINMALPRFDISDETLR